MMNELLNRRHIGTMHNFVNERDNLHMDSTLKKSTKISLDDLFMLGESVIFLRTQPYICKEILPTLNKIRQLMVVPNKKLGVGFAYDGSWTAGNSYHGLVFKSIMTSLAAALFGRMSPIPLAPTPIFVPHGNGIFYGTIKHIKYSYAGSFYQGMLSGRGIFKVQNSNYYTGNFYSRVENLNLATPTIWIQFTSEDGEVSSYCGLNGEIGRAVYHTAEGVEQSYH